jgi:Flp pilus assembly protein TadD
MEETHFQTPDFQGVLKRLALFWTGILLVVLVGLLYFNTLGHQFTNWDDGMIYSNPSIRNLNWEGVKKLFTPEKGNTYQPVRMLSYAIDYRVWKLNPMGYRITNILFYILTCIMVFFTLQRISSRLREAHPPDSHFRVALFGCLLFASHPVHVEAVTWLSARKEVLQGFFFFLAFYLYLMARETEGRKKILFFFVVLLSILMAILSKPSAVVFPAVVLLYEIARKKESLIASLKRHGVFFVFSLMVSGIFTFILLKVMLDAGGIKPYHGGTFLNNLLVSFYVFLYNIKLIIFTMNYSAAYAVQIPFPLLNIQTLLVIAILLLLMGGSLWSLKKTKIFFFSFFFFLITLLPYLNLFPISTLLADRYVFIASFSYCFLLGIGFDTIYRFMDRRFSEGFFKFLSVVLFLFLLGSYSFMTVQQNKIWENSYTLWTDAVEKNPESNTANALLGTVYMELEMNEEAAKHLERAIQIFPLDYESRNNLGIVYGRVGMPERAFRELTTGLAIKPENDTIKINLALHYQREREYEKAEEIFKHLVLKNSKDIRASFRLGVLYKEMGRYEDAISAWSKAIEVAPGIPKLYEEVGNLYISCLQDIERGKYYYIKGIEAASKSKTKEEELRWMVQDLECHQ